MKKFLLVLKDEAGREWTCDGFNNAESAIEDAHRMRIERGWNFVEVIPYEETED